MTLFDDIFAGSGGVADTLLNLFGASCTITYETGSSNNVRTGVYTAGTTVTETAKASPPEPFKESEIDGTVIQRGDLMTLVNEPDLASGKPPIGSTVTLYTKKYRLISCEPIYSGDSVATYKMGLRL